MELLNFARGLESEFTIAGALICVLRVWFKKFNVLVDLFWPNETCEHLLLANKLIMCPFHLAIGYWLWREFHEPLFEMIHDNINWHTSPTPALQCHSWHITQDCKVYFNPHDPWTTAQAPPVKLSGTINIDTNLFKIVDWIFFCISYEISSQKNIKKKSLIWKKFRS